MKPAAMPSAAAPRVGPIVLVSHGSARPRALDRLLQATGRRVVEVRTDRGPGDCVPALNEALEFSGYQEGLGRVLRNGGCAGEAPLVVTFVNDTIASGHPRALARWMLQALHAPRPAALPACIGLRMPLNGGIRAVTGDGGYFSTWAFALVAAPALLARVRFYADDETQEAFAASVRPRLPAVYRQWQQQWLEPSHWLRGWYKALPGRPLDAPTLRRKNVAIYLEHSLLQRLAALGFACIDVGELATPAERRRLQLLRALDKVNVNRLKLQHRLPHLLAAGLRLPR